MPAPARSGKSGKAAKPERRTRSLAKSAITRQRVLAAAATVLLEHGYADTRLSDIAERAGLQAGSLYYYFASKEELVEEVMRYGVQFTHAHVRASVESLPETASPGERLEAAAKAHLEAMLQLGDMAPAHVRTMPQVSSEMQERVRPMRRAFGKFWAELMGAAIESGEVRDDVDPFVLRLFMVNSIENVASWPPRVRRSTDELWTVMREMLFEGVGRPR